MKDFVQSNGWILRKGANGRYERFMKYEPTLSQVHVNAPLTNISIMFMQDADTFVADRVFPSIPVDKKSDIYFAYDRSYFFRNGMKQRAPAAESAGQGYSIDNTPTYTCDVWALHHDIPDQIRGNADSPLKLDAETTNFLSLQAMINREVNWTSNFFAAGKWTTDLTGVTSSGGYGSNQFIQWDQSSSTPIKDIRHFKTVVQQLTGYRPNTLTLNQQVFDTLVDHPDFVDRVKYGQTGTSRDNPAIVNRQIIAQILELQNVYVMGAIQSTAKEGQATQTYAFIGGKAALLSYAPPAPGLMIPSAGYTFNWTGYLGAGAMGQAVTKIRMDWKRVDRVEIEQAYVQKVISGDLGCFFGSAIA